MSLASCPQSPAQIFIDKLRNAGDGTAFADMRKIRKLQVSIFEETKQFCRERMRCPADESEKHVLARDHLKQEVEGEKVDDGMRPDVRVENLDMLEAARELNKKYPGEVAESGRLRPRAAAS